MPSSFKKFLRDKSCSISSISVPKKSVRRLGSMGNLQRQKIGKLTKLETGECRIGEKQGLKHFHNNLTRKRLNGRRYKEFLRLSAQKAKASGHNMLGRRGVQCQEGGEEANCCSEVDARVDGKVDETSILCSEGQRVDSDLTRKRRKVCNVNSEDECSQLSPVGGAEGQAQNCTQLTDEHAHDTESVKSQPEIEKESHCAICMLGGKLLCCNGQGCRKSFHLSCVDPPLTFSPPGIWHCSWCTGKKIEFGVHSVSQGIESILDSREFLSDDEVMHKQKEYLVKYKSLAHVHNRWILETQLRLEAPTLFERDKGKKSKWKAEWSVPHRLVKKRLIVSPEPCNGYDGKDSDCDYEWLVKWRGLNYDHSTWELANASFLMTPQAMMLIKNFESRKQNSNPISDPSTKDEELKITPVQLSEFPFEVSPGLHDCQLTYVNKLRGYWSRGQNAVVFDEDRIEKVVLFILSLQCDACQPVLIITSSNTISLWEEEFSRCSSSADVVMYNGSRDVRAIIRTLEFYDESGRVSFQVLLSTPDAIVEDIEMLDHIKWEVMVIDECQRPVISVHLVQLKILAADMKLLLFSGEVLDRRFNYHNVLSLIDSEFEKINEDTAVDSISGTHKLKEQLAEYIAYESKFDSTPIFSEYWIPVRLSSMQVEQYSDLLLSNSRLLCSSLKNDATDSLREILSLTQKCCDHPYLVDHSLRSCVTRGLPLDDHLNAEINVSGKLQLLDMILSGVKERGLKVLVLFQSVVSSGKISIGDILDDLVHRRFGDDYYARIEGGMTPPRRQAALDMFNNKESTNFICLMDYRACVSSTKLSSLDIVILFNSDLNPLNDIRSLQKITIDPQFEQIKVFRLYSCFTIEEKSLILAKQGVIFDSKLQRINRSSCHMLLTWGASYLLNKSGDFNSHISSGKSFLDDVLSDLLAQLSNTCEDGIASNGSIILKLEHKEGTYPSNIRLLGEVSNPSTTDIVDSEAPHVFWKNVLEERHHSKWKHLYTPSRRVHRKTQMYGACLESENARSKHQKLVNNTISKMRSRNKKKLLADVEGSHPKGATELSTGKRSKRLRNRKTAKDTPSRPCLSRTFSRHSRHETVAGQESLSQSHQHLSSHEIPFCWDPDQEQPPLEDSTQFFIISPTSQPSTYMHGVPNESDTSHLRNTNAESETQNGRPLLPVIPEVTQSAGTDPLQREMERIQKDMDEATKAHQEMQWRLNLECEKEIANIRKKYAALNQESEAGLVKQMEILESKYKIVYNSRLLAQALAMKCNNAEVAISDATQEATISHFVDDILKLYYHSTLESSQMTDPPVAPTTQLVVHPSAIPPTHGRRTSTMAETQRTTAPSQLVNFPPRSAPIISPVEACHLSIPTINSVVSSLPGSGFRAPAPHLRNSMPNLTNFDPLPSIHEPPLTPFMPTQAAGIQSGNEGSTSGVGSSLFPPDLPDGINMFPPLDLDFPDLFSLQNLGSNYRAI